MKRKIVGRMVFSLLAASVLCLSQVAVASASGGNSQNAKACQKGGWEHLYTSRYGSFTSEEQCTSYAANGGTLISDTGPRCNAAADNTVYATQGVPVTYDASKLFSGGVPPLTYSVEVNSFFGSLPAGLTLNTQTGLITGTPTVSGDFVNAISATDANNFSCNLDIVFVVQASS